MICHRTVITFCCEDLNLIENYETAINDKEQTWHCHHRLEIQNGKVYSRKDLIDMNLYYNRPASELIFLTKSMHSSLHSSCSGWNNAKRIRKAQGFTKKCKWLTPSGQIIEMSLGIVRRFHKNWKQVLH